MGLNVKLDQVEIRGEGYVILPFGFQINGVVDPDNRQGVISAAVRSEAGEFLCTIDPQLGKPYSCLYGAADPCTTADDVDLYGKVDWSTVASAGTFVVRTMTGAVQTDPPDNTLVGGFLLVKKTDRVP